MADPVFDVQGLVGDLAKFNPVSAIPGLVQQGQQAVNPYIQMLMQLLGQGQQAPTPGMAGAQMGGIGPNPLSGVQSGGPLKNRMTR